MTIFTQKHPDAIEIFSLNFGDMLMEGEVIVSAICTLSVKEGVDPDVSSMTVGSAVINGSYVSQIIKNGVDGVYYYFEIVAVTSLQTLVGEAILPVGVLK